MVDALFLGAAPAGVDVAEKKVFIWKRNDVILRKNLLDAWAAVSAYRKRR